MEKSIKAAAMMTLFQRTPNFARRFLPQAIWCFPERKSDLFLTFDDGPDPEFTPELLNLLAKHEIHAAFFLIGEKARKYPRLVRKIVAAGHHLGNHTMHHHRLRWPRRRIVREEIQSAQKVLQDCAGISVRFFRPPYGALSPAILGAARELNLRLTMWSLMPGDVWRVDNPSAIVSSIINNVRSGDIILLHDGHRCGPATIAALRATIPMLKERDYRFNLLPDDF
jgi:peptidoglycan/xylan/chitin deacetylase (PgdA/CDA1 family)